MVLTYSYIHVHVGDFKIRCTDVGYVKFFKTELTIEGWVFKIIIILTAID